jgi:hypothetical protein
MALVRIHSEGLFSRPIVGNSFEIATSKRRDVTALIRKPLILLERATRFELATLSLGIAADAAN